MSSYFKDFPQYLYDFNYGNNKTKTKVVVDITRNIRFKQEVLSNIALYDEYDIVDGETPEMISEKFYGTPEYHWVIMMANEKYDYRKDFPLIEPILQKHIAQTYNPVLRSTDWRIENQKIYVKFYNVTEPFDLRYLTAPVHYNIKFKFGSIDRYLAYHWPNGNSLVLDETTQYFYQDLDSPAGTILASQANQFVHGTNTNFKSIFIGSKIYDNENQLIGVVKSIESNNLLTLTEHCLVNVDYKSWSWQAVGQPEGELTVTTHGRENNPIYFVNTLGQIVNPSPTAIPVTGDQIHRLENDAKRRIKIISPSLLEIVIRNYEEEL